MIQKKYKSWPVNTTARMIECVVFHLSDAIFRKYIIYVEYKMGLLTFGLEKYLLIVLSCIQSHCQKT